MPIKQRTALPLWKELKRRKVPKNVAMYAATSFIIMEASDIMLPRLGLPEWTVTFIIVLLIAGFPISIFLSWIYDITPEGIRKTSPNSPEEANPKILQSGKRKLRFSDVIIAILFAAVCILLYPKLFQRDKFDNIREEDGRISIAVMPFTNQTGDSNLNYLERGISSLIINGLGNSAELSVRNDHAMHEVLTGLNDLNLAGFNPSLGKEAARLAMAETYITGSFLGSDDQYVILANLIETESGDVIWSHKQEGNLTTSDYLEMGNKLCLDIRDHLELKALKEEADYDFREAYTQFPEAYRYYMEGMEHILVQNYDLAIESMKRALQIDSTFAYAAFYIAWSHCYGNNFEGIEYWTAKAHEMSEGLPTDFRYLVELWNACYITKDGAEISEYCGFLDRSETRSRLFWFDLAVTYSSILKEYDQSIRAFEKIEEINKEREQVWKYFDYYEWYIRTLHDAAEYEKELEISDLALKLFPENYWLTRRRLSLALIRSDSTEIEKYTGRIQHFRQEENWSEASYETRLAYIYYRAHKIAESAAHARKAYDLEPQNITYKRNLAYVLIFEDLDLEQGLEFMKDVLDEDPENALHNYYAGVACRKLGKLDLAHQYLARAIENNRGYGLEYKTELELVTQLLTTTNS